MTYTQATKVLKRLQKRGYVPYHSGLVKTEVPRRWGGNTTGWNWGVNIDGDGSPSHPFGCPVIIWDYEDSLNY